MNQFKCSEKDISIPFGLNFQKICDSLSSKFPTEQILRFISSEFTPDYFKANILTTNHAPQTPNIFKFRKRTLKIKKASMSVF